MKKEKLFYCYVYNTYHYHGRHLHVGYSSVKSNSEPGCWVSDIGLTLEEVNTPKFEKFIYQINDSSYSMDDAIEMVKGTIEKIKKKE